MRQLGPGKIELLQTFQVQVEGLAGVGERFGQRVTAGDNVWNIGKVHHVGRLFGLIDDGEDVVSVFVGSGQHLLKELVAPVHERPSLVEAENRAY